MSPRRCYRTWSLFSPHDMSLQKISVAIRAGRVCGRPTADFLAGFFILLLLFGVTVACRSAADTPSVPTAAPISVTSTAPIMPVAVLPPTTVPNTAIPSTGTVSISSLMLPLPEDWSYLLLDKATYHSELLHVAGADIALQAVVTDLFTHRKESPQLLVAWPHQNQQGIGLLAYVLPLPNITLPRYLAAIEAQLATTSFVSLREVETLFSLRDDHPVGYVQYNITTAGQSTFQGHHYALFNDNATELLLLTFVTTGEVLLTDEDLHLPFAALVQEVRFGSAIAE